MNNNKDNQEKVLIRSGDLLNSLGILRSARIHDGTLKKEEFIELIKKNYLLHENIPQNIKEEIENIWLESIKIFSEMGIDNKSTFNEIRIKETLILPSISLK